MKRIGICDDNEVLLEKYSGMINKISIEKGLDIEIVKFCSGIELLDFLKEDAQGIDIIFLDILMDYLNGVETAEKIREIKSNAIIIFLTSSEEYIFETIKVKSFAYLMKDELTEESLENILLKAVKKIDEQRENVFCFEKNNEIYQISFQDICFIKFYGGYCYIHH